MLKHTLCFQSWGAAARRPLQQLTLTRESTQRCQGLRFWSLPGEAAEKWAAQWEAVLALSRLLNPVAGSVATAHRHRQRQRL